MNWKTKNKIKSYIPLVPFFAIFILFCVALVKFPIFGQLMHWMATWALILFAIA